MTFALGLDLREELFADGAVLATPHRVAGALLSARTILGSSMRTITAPAIDSNNVSRSRIRSRSAAVASTGATPPSVFRSALRSTPSVETSRLPTHGWAGVNRRAAD